MSARENFLYRLSIGVVVMCLMAVSAVWVSGQTTSDVRSTQQPATTQAAGVPDDWSHHHVVFSNPGTFADALRNGKLEDWNRISSDPRYKIQELKRNLLQRQLQSAPDFAARMELVNRSAATADAFKNPLKRPVSSETRKDWSMALGQGGSSAASTTGTVSAAATDGQTLVIANPNTSTSLTLTASAGTAASATGTFAGEPSTGGTLTISGLGNTLILTAGAANSTSCTFTSHSSIVNFARSFTLNTNAANLRTVINVAGCGSVVGVTASAPGGSRIVITAATAGSAGNSITVHTTSAPNFRIAAWTTATNLAGGTDGTQSGLNFATSSTASTEAANIVSAINLSGNGSSVGVSATQGAGANNDQVIVTASSAGPAGNNITITNGLTGFSIGSPLAGGSNGTTATLAAGQFPAKYSFSTATASCADYVVYGTGIPGGSGQATVVAYNNIYATTCGTPATRPGIYWAYNTGGTAALSPVLSLDGSQVAYIQTVSSVASLVVLKMANSGGTASAPAAITSVAPGAYSACTAPCYTTLTLNGSRNDTHSQPFYDYAYDLIWVGDDGGYLHKLTGVFSGTPAEAATGGWPVQASTQASPALTGPIYDSGASALIFVGDSSGYLHSVTTTGASSQTVLTASQNVCGTAGMVDPPLVDSSTEQVYVFVGYGCDATHNSYVNRFAAGTSISAAFGQNYVSLGNASTNTTSSIMRDGAFDNVYYSGSGTTGNLYVCENGTLFQVPMSALSGTGTVTPNTFSTPVSSVGSSSTCSALTEFSTDATHDYLFLSLVANGNASTSPACTGACIYNYNVHSAGTTGTPISGLASAGGSSGIIIDNSSAAAGESQIYFSTLGSQSCGGNGTTGSGTGGCAVQASQAGLQ